jgi:phosphoglucosamine mutase
MGLKYFGTDGIRGRAFDPPLSIEELYNWGIAWAAVAKNNSIKNMVIGWDGRTSCTALLKAFLTGFSSEIKTTLLGIVPTPAVAWVVSRQANAWGLVISASHNPPEDNGLKGFDSKGVKLPEDVEQAIETAFIASINDRSLEGRWDDKTSLPIQTGPMEEYLAHLGGMQVPASFPIVIDCAHGATAQWAGRLFSGAVQWVGTPADGGRINVGVGSTQLDTLRNQVIATKAAAGVAFDGDGDRCLILDGEGEIVDGDQMLWLLATEQTSQGARPPGLIGTVMSNGALEQGLNELNIPFLRTPVGDKFLVRELDATGWSLAAEPSGHMIQRHFGPSGDGMATALSILRILVQKPMESRWSWRFNPWPLKLVNINTKLRKDLEQCHFLQKAIGDIEKEHGESIRLLIRWSGTEPLLRLMAEANEGWQVEQALKQLTCAAKADLLT